MRCSPLFFSGKVRYSHGGQTKILTKIKFKYLLRRSIRGLAIAAGNDADLEQAALQRLFQPLDLLAGRRLAHVERGRRTHWEGLLGLVDHSRTHDAFMAAATMFFERHLLGRP